MSDEELSLGRDRQQYVPMKSKKKSYIPSECTCPKSQNNILEFVKMN